ncbi:MAG: hypothetical protein VYB72_08615, partial [Planctomycetota bacterium]|nr:hypothetical protein [Planctomycetota bacterium]
MTDGDQQQQQQRYHLQSRSRVSGEVDFSDLCPTRKPTEVLWWLDYSPFNKLTGGSKTDQRIERLAGPINHVVGFCLDSRES